MRHLRHVVAPLLLLVALALPVLGRPDGKHKDKDKDKDKKKSETSQVAPADQPPPLDIQQMIDQTPDGGRVTVPRGKHVLARGVVLANRNGLTLFFERDSHLLVDDIMQDVLAIQDCRDIRVVGGELRHLKPSPQYQCHGSVVRVTGSRKVTLEGCELNGSGATGVFADGAAELLVTRCWLHHNTFNAFYLANCVKVDIIGNVVEDNANTMDAHQVDQLSMSDNLVRRNGGYWRARLEEPGPSDGDWGRDKGHDKGKQ